MTYPPSSASPTLEGAAVTVTRTVTVDVGWAAVAAGVGVMGWGVMGGVIGLVVMGVGCAGSAIATGYAGC